MNDSVAVNLKPHVAAELKRLAVLAGSDSDAVERLMAFWNANQAAAPAIKTEPPGAPARASAAMWRSSTGDELPVGARLEATYKGKAYYATVEQQGIRFAKGLHQSPSAAGRAVKNSVGVSGSAAQTDGRTFWSVRDPSTGRLVSIGELNPKHLIDADEIVRELLQGSAASAA